MNFQSTTLTTKWPFLSYSNKPNAVHPSREIDTSTFGSEKDAVLEGTVLSSLGLATLELPLLTFVSQRSASLAKQPDMLGTTSTPEIIDSLLLSLDTS